VDAAPVSGVAVGRCRWCWWLWRHGRGLPWHKRAQQPRSGL